MLHQATYWTEITGFAVNAVLLCRVLALRLYRVYLFITLACILGLLFDGAVFWLGEKSQASTRIFIYSRFVYAFVFPMVAWDVFEEMKAQVAKLRRLAIARLISGLFFAVVFGLIMAAFADDSSGEPVLVGILALVLWVGTSTASFAFLYTMYRTLRTQPIVRPNNTNVWMYYYGLSFLAEVLFCFSWFVTDSIKSETLGDVLAMVFTIFDIALTGWCIFKLRAIPSDLPSASPSTQL